MAFDSAQTIPAPAYAGVTIAVFADVGSGTVLIEAEYDSGWLTIETIEEDGARIVETGRIGRQIRISPTGDAEFEFTVAG